MNKSFEEIAKMIGISRTTAHRLHLKAIEKLRDKLAAEPDIAEWLKTTRANKGKHG